MRRMGTARVEKCDIDERERRRRMGLSHVFGRHVRSWQDDGSVGVGTRGIATSKELVIGITDDWQEPSSRAFSFACKVLAQRAEHASEHAVCEKAIGEDREDAAFGAGVQCIVGHGESAVSENGDIKAPSDGI